MYFLLGATYLGAFLFVTVSLPEGFLVFFSWCFPGMQDCCKLNGFNKIKFMFNFHLEDL